MSIKSLTENFWEAYNLGNPEKALAVVPKIEKHYENWANKLGHDPIEAKQVFMKDISWAIIQAHEQIIDKLRNFYGDERAVKPTKITQ